MRERKPLDFVTLHTQVLSEYRLFSFTNLNITYVFLVFATEAYYSTSTEDQLRQYMRTNYIVGATDAEMTRLLQLYPADVTQGSPYDTGIFNALTPQFKRIASLQGDIFFQVNLRPSRLGCTDDLIV